MKKILFPFFNNDRHNFLLKKVWFRTLMVIYLCAMVLVVPVSWVAGVNGVFGRCEVEARNYFGNGEIPNPAISLDNFNSYHDYLEGCNQATRSLWSTICLEVTIISIALHYFIQFVFFKIVVDFIVLGSKK